MKPQNKIDHHSREQRRRQHGRSIPIIKPTLAPLPYTLRPPVESIQRVDHRQHGHDGEEQSSDAARRVAKI